jgi:hypothetical protein
MEQDTIENVSLPKKDLKCFFFICTINFIISFELYDQKGTSINDFPCLGRYIGMSGMMGQKFELLHGK